MCRHAPPLPSLRHRHRQAFALLMTLAALSTLALLTIAILSLSSAERRSAGLAATTSQTSQVADLIPQLVIAQLKAATAPTDAMPSFWAAQPGAVRRYALDGTFIEARKLYSSATMIHSSDEAGLLLDSPPPTWQDQPHQFTDLNRPVIRRPAQGSNPHPVFPIVDPRAALPTSQGTAPVVGFSYSPQATPGGAALGGVITPDAAAPHELRLPMPVRWLYLLKDGSIGTLDATSRYSGQGNPSRENPIVARIAFWADDETGKLPVNSAAISTPFATPSLLRGGGPTPEDLLWARSPPATGEYQRFPGHPATTSLLPALAPGRTLGAEAKGLVYQMVPKLAHIGTLAGTRELDQDALPYLNHISQAERLYASTDDFLFRLDRTPNPLHLDPGVATDGAGAATLLSRSSFFLSATSRAPDYTLRGTPRIAMWPIDNRGPEFQTVFDRLIARCSVLNAHAFHFVRERHDHATHDISLPRNQQLLDYLDHLASAPAAGYPVSFHSKYPADTRRLFISIFDYIRSTNLYDARLENPNFTTLTSPNNTYPRLLTNLPSSHQAHKTFTPGRFGGRLTQGYHNVGFGLFPGHGQVLPSQPDPQTVGFGRVYSLGEVSALFIACAHGTANEVNPYRDDPGIPDPWKGGFATPGLVNQVDPEGNSRPFPDNDTIHFSNFPPSPQGQPYGANTSHPGYRPENWNLALEPNKPLPPGTTRVQSTLLLDWFSVTGGYTILRGHFGVRIRGLSNLSLEGQPLYPKDEVLLRPYWDVGDCYHNGYRGGGDADIRGLPRGRKAPPIGNRPADTNYNNPGAPGLHSDQRNYDLISNYIDVPGEQMTFSASGPVEIELLSPYDDSAPPYQTFAIHFPNSSSVPTPLMTPTHMGSPTDNAVRNAGSFFWSFHADGYNGSVRTNTWETRGRLFDTINVPGGYGGLYRYLGDTICSMVPWHGDLRLTSGKPSVDLDPSSPYTAGGQRWEFVPHHTYPSGTNRGSHTVMARHAHWWHRYFHGAPADRLFPDAWTGGFAFKFPNSPAAAAVAHRFGDFDRGPGNLPSGALINKPDEGDFSNRANVTPYFSQNWMFDEYTEAFFSPSRMVSSAVMLGSLPTNIIDPDPWRTLFFRPQAPTNYGKNHPGAAAAQGGIDPPDHVLLDWFRMPVVEPYAISDPTSSGGKININHQILPFRHISRSTALHGLLADQLIHKINVANNGYHAPIDAPTTLAAISARLESGRLFTSLGQFCEIHLVPFSTPAHGDPAAFTNASADVASRMGALWSHFRGTADNVKERPYSNIIPRLETRSNTWTIHYHVQTLGTPRTADPALFDPTISHVVGDTRGSFVIERFIDPDDPALPDHAVDPAAPSLDHLHDFRVLSRSSFAPQP